MSIFNKTESRFGGELAEEVAIKEREEIKAKSNFLFAFNYLARKHDIDLLNDVDIDFKNMTINVKTKVEDRKLLIFIAELEKLTGQLK